MTIPALARYRRVLDGYLQALLDRSQPETLDRMMRYHLGWQDEAGAPSDNRGKALRPTLCMLSCEAAGGSSHAAVPAAAAVELVHNFSLVHDDIQDRDAERHHRATVWTVWGEAQAINAGDALLALARLAVLHSPEHGVSHEATVAAARTLDERTLEMVEGQVMDLEFEKTLDVGLDAYLEMIARKTGALFECALQLGAIVAGSRSDVISKVGMFGHQMGLVFQIRDDMLGIWGAENRTGKEAAADIRRKKKSLPIVYALSSNDNAVRDQLREVYSGDVTDDGVSKVLACLDSIGAQRYCNDLATRKKEEALTALDAAGLTGAAAGELREVAGFLLERDY